MVETQFHTFGSPEEPFTLFNGETLPGVTLAYTTHGTLNADKSNAVLLFHALTGSHHCAGTMPSVPGHETLWRPECQEGWWNDFVGPGAAIDTDKHFVICANYLGSCYGSSGPRTIDPRTGERFGGHFPHIRLVDMVDTQMRLVDHLGIDKLHAIVGASLGGILATIATTKYPDRVNAVANLSSGITVPVLTRIHNFEQILAIEQDTNWRGGHYYGHEPPNLGLALARSISHKTFVSLNTLVDRARKEVVPSDHFAFYEFSNPVESYLHHQCMKFVKRFDSNSYVRIIEAWSRFDLAEETGTDSIHHALARCTGQKFLVFSIDSDVCFYPEEQFRLAAAIRNAGHPCQHITVHSANGHDAFLLEPDLFKPQLNWFLDHVRQA